MKKLLVVVLTGVLCATTLCLTACGNQEGVSQGNPASDIIEDISAMAESEESQDDAQSNHTETSDFSIGRMEGRTYINEYFDFYCALDNNWDILSEEELVSENQRIISSWNSSVEGIEDISWSDESFKDMLDNIPLDMQLMVAKGRNESIVIMVKKADFETEEEYTKHLESYANSLEEQYSSWDDNAEVTISEKSFNGYEMHDCIEGKFDINGQSNYQRLMIIREGDYYASILALSSAGFEEIDTFFDWFGDAKDAVIIEAEPEVQYEADYLLGTIEEYVYTNESLGFCFDGGESCQYVSIEELQAKDGRTYDKDTLNKLLKWGNIVVVCDAKVQNGGFRVLLLQRDAEIAEGVTLRGNEEDFMQGVEESTRRSTESICEQLEFNKCTPESMGSVAIGGFDMKGFYSEKEEWKYGRTLFVQTEEFFGCIVLSADNEEEIQRLTDSLTKIEE